MLTRIVCAHHAVARVRGIIEAITKPHERADGCAVEGVALMPGGEVAAVIEADKHDGITAQASAVLFAMGLGEVEVRTPDAGADLAEARRRLIDRIQGDGPAELRRYERAKARFAERTTPPKDGCANCGAEITDDSECWDCHEDPFGDPDE